MADTKPNLWHGIPREEIPWFPTVDADACIGCQLCYVTCGRAVYEMRDGVAVAVDPMSCAVGLLHLRQHLPDRRDHVPAARRRVEARTRTADLPHRQEGSRPQARTRGRAQSARGSARRPSSRSRPAPGSRSPASSATSGSSSGSKS